MKDVFEKTIGPQLLQILQEKGMYPFFRVIESTQGTSVTHKNKQLIMMGSNNYLGLTHDKRVKKAAIDAIEEWGTGCTGSRFLNGNLLSHELLEDKLKNFFGYEAALVFSSGFLANQGAMSSLVGKDEYILSDSENHACIIEGCRLSPANVVVYSHNDMFDLEKKLKSLPPEAAKLIVTDGIFSMTGVMAKFDRIFELAKIYNARTYIDEAHSIGVVGRGGRGVASYFGVQADVLMGTFSKSLASQGGFICGSKEVVEWVKLNGRTMMFSAALSPSSVAAASAALDVLMEGPHLVQELANKSCYLKSAFDREGFNTLNSESSIIPIFVGDDINALSICVRLQQEGIFATPVVYPAVPKGQAIIRFSVMVNHSLKELDIVCEKMKMFKQQIGHISKTSLKSLHEIFDKPILDKN